MSNVISNFVSSIMSNLVPTAVTAIGTVAPLVPEAVSSGAWVASYVDGLSRALGADYRLPLFHADICGYCGHTGLPLYKVTTASGDVLDEDVWAPVRTASLRAKKRKWVLDGDLIVVRVQRPRRKYRRWVAHVVSFAKDVPVRAPERQPRGVIETALKRPF